MLMMTEITVEVCAVVRRSVRICRLYSCCLGCQLLRVMAHGALLHFYLGWFLCFPVALRTGDPAQSVDMACGQLALQPLWPCLVVAVQTVLVGHNLCIGMLGGGHFLAFVARRAIAGLGAGESLCCFSGRVQ